MANEAPVFQENPSLSPSIHEFVDIYIPESYQPSARIRELNGSQFLAEFPELHVFAVNIQNNPYSIIGVTAEPGSKMYATDFSVSLVSAQIQAITALEKERDAELERILQNTHLGINIEALKTPFIINLSDLRNTRVSKVATGTLSTAGSMLRKTNVIKHLVVGQGMGFKLAYQVFVNFLNSPTISIYENPELAAAEVARLLSGEV
jgi:hypothetical protein